MATNFVPLSVAFSILICATAAAQIPLPTVNDLANLVDDDKRNALNRIAAAGPDAEHLRFAVIELVCSDDDPDNFRYLAACALARMYGDSKRQVDFALSHVDPDVRGVMASAIQYQGEGEHMYAKRLLELSDDDNESVSNSALETLAALRLHSPEVLTHLRAKMS